SCGARLRRRRKSAGPRRSRRGTAASKRLLRFAWRVNYTRSRFVSNGGRSLDRADLDLRLQRLMHRAFIGDLHQTLALLGVERSLQRDGAIDVIDLADFGVAGRAILGVNLF